jgi:Na+-driven multidrug efflux pump
MYKTLKSYLKADRKFLRNMLKIALPIMIQNLVTSSLNMADTIMVGKLGEVEIAAVGIANQYFFFFTMIFNLNRLFIMIFIFVKILIVMLTLLGLLFMIQINSILFFFFFYMF